MKFLVVNASPNANGNTSKFVAAFTKAAEGKGEIQILNLHDDPPQYSHGSLEVPKNLTKYQRAVLDCDALFIATPTYWFNVPAILKAFIEELALVEDELDKRPRALSVAVYAPQGGEQGVANALVFPLNHMSFVLVEVGYIFHRGVTEDDWAWEQLALMPERMKRCLGQ